MVMIPNQEAQKNANSTKVAVAEFQCKTMETIRSGVAINLLVYHRNQVEVNVVTVNQI